MFEIHAEGKYKKRNALWGKYNPHIFYHLYHQKVNGKVLTGDIQLALNTFTPCLFLTPDSFSTLLSRSTRAQLRLNTESEVQVHFSK